MGLPLPFQALRQRRQPLRHGKLRPQLHAAHGGAGGLDVAAHRAAEGGEDHWEVLETQRQEAAARFQPPKSGRFAFRCVFSLTFI